ncbi:MAG: DUF2752 domain-containing protein [Dysgonamonadaceae bacterium]|jgi:hypothetical protein|nr:DUF2752 domain-containing protein [Dysgonamonadaceae bacterium]
MTQFVQWIEDHLLTCPSKHFFHIDCPGCGLQRSVLALFEGDLVKSVQLYPATIPILFCFIFTALHLKFDFKHGAEIIKWSYILSATIIFVFYCYKIFTYKLI